jgi:hypothetical protein
MYLNTLPSDRKNHLSQHHRETDKGRLVFGCTASRKTERRTRQVTVCRSEVLLAGNPC